MNGNRASGLKKGYSGPSVRGSNYPDRKGIETRGDFRQASHTIQKMQLDVGVSQPANIMTFRPSLTYLTFDLDPRDL